MSRRAFIGFSILFVLIISVQMTLPSRAGGYIGLCCGHCGGNMPINFLTAGIPETFEYRIRPRFIFSRMEGLREGNDDVSNADVLNRNAAAPGEMFSVPLSMDMSMFPIMLGYSFHEDFSAMLGMPYLYKRMPMERQMVMEDGMVIRERSITMRSSGPGDTLLLAKYRLYADDPLIPTSQFSLIGGSFLPTGSFNKKFDRGPLRGTPLPPSMQLGTGSFSPVLGVSYSGSRDPFWYHGLFLYRYIPENDFNYEFGDRFSYDLSLQYQFHPRAVLDLELNGAWQGESRDEDERRLALARQSLLFDQSNTGGHKLWASVGLQYQPVPFTMIEASFSVPIYQDVNGTQLESNYRFLLGFYIEWPSGGSIRRMEEKARKGLQELGF